MPRSRSNARRFVPCVLLLLAASAAAARAQRPQVLSPEQFLGYALGERFTPAGDVFRYFEHLAAAAPERVRVQEYGRTVEGRPLLQAVIARADRLAELDAILARNRRLTDPALPAAEAAQIAATNPAIVYLSYGVHGNESSSSEAAMWTAWDLVRGAAEVAGALDSVVVVIDPVVNPDGRDRYVLWYKQARGVVPNPHPLAREHQEPWPGGRFNHYLFDLNRDWAWATQPETRARLATWDRWLPQVHVDYHEMSSASTYFFFPAAEPINPIYPQHLLEWGRIIGAANAAAFDARGWEYFTGDTYDFFYPGYGDSWPGFLGAIGMTYEQAGGGGAGLVIRQPDGDLLTLHDRAQHHRVTGHATIGAAAARKTALLEGFAATFRALPGDLPDFLIVPGRDARRAEALVALLQDQGIRVERAARAFRADAAAHPGWHRRTEFPAGTYLVRANQPRARLAVTLLQPETELDATFSYDISAWSLPYAYGVETHRVDDAPRAEWRAAETIARGFEPSAGSEWSGSLVFPVERAGRAGGGVWGTVGGREPHEPAASEPYGYLLEPGFAAWPELVRYMGAGGHVVVMDEPFTIEGRAWPRGTIFIARRGAAERPELGGLAAQAVPVRTGRVEAGNDLGTRRSYTLRLPRLGVITGEGVTPTSYGAHWYFLEQHLRLAFDAIPSSALARADLGAYDVIVVPEARLDDAQTEALKRWVEAGGTLVAVGRGAGEVAEPIAGIEAREAERDSADLERALLGREARELERWEQGIPGTILPATLDPAHPLAFGAGADGDSARLYVLHGGGTVFEPSTDYETVAYFPDPLERTSGVISQENLDRLERSTWLATTDVGSGRVILFADDPLFRAFWYGGFQPYTNAILVGPRL